MAEPLSSLIRPEIGPVLPAFARLALPAPSELIAAEVETRSSPGDVVIDLFGRGGWVARAAVMRQRRAYSFESSALMRLLAEVVMRPPDIRHFDAAVNAMAVQPRGQLGLREALAAMFETRCPTCERAVTADEFIWDGQSPAPFRKVYRCPFCRDQQGSTEQRSSPTDERDAELARAVDDSSARHAMRARFPILDGRDELPAQLLELYTPRSLVAIEAILSRLETDLRAAPIEAALRLALLHVVLPASRLNSYPGRVAALRITNGTVRSPGERQWREANPWKLFEDGCRVVRGFIQRLEATNTGTMQPRIGDDLLSLLDGTANAVLRRGSAALRTNTPAPVDVSELDEVDSGLDALTVRALPAASATSPAALAGGRARVKLVLTQPPPRWTPESLSFAYLGTAIVLGRDAAATLPLEAVLGPAPKGEWGWEAAALRRSLAAIEPILARDARVVVMLEPTGAEGLVAGALGGVGAGYRLDGALLAEPGEQLGGTLEFLPPGSHRPPGPGSREAASQGGAQGGPFQLRVVQRAVTDVAVSILQERGEPAHFDRLLGEVLVGLDRAGHLRRLVGTRTYSESEARSERAAEAVGLLGDVPLQLRHTEIPELTDAPVPEQLEHDGEHADGADVEPDVAGSSADGADAVSAPAARRPAARRSSSDHVGLLLDLIVGELRRDDHPRLQELEPGSWWLRDKADIAHARAPLSDRLEWSVFSLLSTGGRLTEAAFIDRVARMFRGHDAPDESLVRACLDSYRSLASTPDALFTNDELHERHAQHSEMIGLLADYGHRLGLRVWISEHEQRRRWHGRTLSTLLTEQERTAHLPLVSRGPVEILESMDCIWYVRGKARFFFEVEWTAMLGEPVLRRGPRIPQEPDLVRFLVIPPERTELVRFKLDRSPLLREALEQGNWHILKWDHLRALAGSEEAGLERLEPYLGLDPIIERQGEQLPLFDATARAATG